MHVLFQMIVVYGKITALYCQLFRYFRFFQSELAFPLPTFHQSYPSAFSLSSWYITRCRHLTTILLTKSIKICHGCCLGYDNSECVPEAPYNTCEQSILVSPLSQSSFNTKTTVHFSILQRVVGLNYSNKSYLWYTCYMIIMGVLTSAMPKMPM